MNIRNALKLGDEYLRKRNIENSLNECKWMMEDILDVPHSELLRMYTEHISLKKMFIFHKWVKRRGKHEPMDYIIGHKPFMGMDIKVTRDVLIPRDDTETVINSGINALMDYGVSLISEDKINDIKKDLNEELDNKDYARKDLLHGDSSNKDNDEDTLNISEIENDAKNNANKSKSELFKERHNSEFEIDDIADLENDEKLDDDILSSCRFGEEVPRLSKEEIYDMTAVIDEDNADSYKSLTAKNKLYYDDFLTNRLNSEALKTSYKIMDMCTGSGIIGLSLARYFTNSNVYLCDISKKALDIASFNARHNKITNTEVINTNMFSAFSDEKYNDSFDMIISNPPYIKSDICKTLDSEVKDFEPMIALDGGSDGLDFYKIIINESKRLLKNNGVLTLEIDYTYFKDLFKILQGAGFIDITCTKDMNNLDRCITAKLIK